MLWQECESAEYELCGRAISIGREGLQLGEALLNGRAMGIDEPSLAETVLGAVSSHPDPAVRKVGNPAPCLLPDSQQSSSCLASSCQDHIVGCLAWWMPLQFCRLFLALCPPKLSA